MRFETLAVHAGLHADPATGAVIPPIQLSTTFEREPDGAFPRGYIYSRDHNPNRSDVEECLTLLEGGAACAAFASGSAATAALFQSLRPGQRVVLGTDAFYGTVRLLRDVFEPWGLQHAFVDMSDHEAVTRALADETALVWLETPSNPLLRLTDIAVLCEKAHAAGALVAVDNTWCTPMLQRPFELGADYVVHSTTKYLGGHSDVVGGAVIARDQAGLFGQVRLQQKQGGGIPSPFDCWLLLRGIRTLPYRMRAHCENAQKVARYLTEHGAVQVVHFPGLPTHPGHQIAQKQLSMFGGMLSFEVRGGRAEALRVTGGLKLFTRATSLGGPESLIEHRASIEGPGTRAPENLLRVSIGLEHADDLIEDLQHALELLA